MLLNANRIPVATNIRCVVIQASLCSNTQAWLFDRRTQSAYNAQLPLYGNSGVNPTFTYREFYGTQVPSLLTTAVFGIVARSRQLVIAAPHA